MDSSQVNDQPLLFQKVLSGNDKKERHRLCHLSDTVSDCDYSPYSASPVRQRNSNLGGISLQGEDLQ